MLKSIELYGFKSFADRTRMEFDEGICALVGPNGSGKSNIVDAIKWALGEQSAKRLRGDEMTDVIFNGSSSRAPLGAAEVTLVFDNSKRLLPFDSDEIALTRRVYRSGESEYLINGQASRLKDFRDLIVGAGLGSQGYAVIEQGRVEALLQSTSAQRRAALEEAAGIARFNAKKQEVSRRLERVEQNLLRLSDLVGEVETQLRRTKAQAGKAESYRLYTTRLQKLRTEVSLYEWRVKSEERAKLSAETNDYATFEAECNERIAAAELEQTEATTKLSETETRLRQIESDLSATRERLAAEESTIDFQSVQIEDWRAESTRRALQAYELRTRGLDDEANVRQTRVELKEARDASTKIATDFERENVEIDALAQRASNLNGVREELQRDLQEKNAESGRLVGELSGLDARRRTIEQSVSQKKRQRDEITRRQTELQSEVKTLESEEEEAENKRATSYRRLGELKVRREDLRRDLGARQAEFSELERKRAAFDERSTILNDLLRKYEGLSPGVKETLRSMRNPNSPFRHAYGLVADLIRVNVEAAPLIELALGQTAQYVVVPPEPELFRYIERQGSKFTGRVGFIWLDPNPSKPILLDPKLDGQPGVLGRADQFVETEPQFASLVQRLLRRTWIVESIAVAKRLYREVDEPTNFLSADGSALSADGTLVVGMTQGGAGLISRRSELASLSSETEKLEEEFERLRVDVASLKNDLSQADSEFELEANVQREATQVLESIRLRQTASLERKAQLDARQTQLEKETSDLEVELQKTIEELNRCNEEKILFDKTVETIAKRLEERQQELDSCAAERQEKTKRTTHLKIELAKAEERIVFLTDRLRRLDEGREEQTRRVGEYESRVEELNERIAKAELCVLTCESSLAILYSCKEELSRRQNQIQLERTQLERARAKISFELKFQRDALEKKREKIRTKELSLERFSQEIKVLEERMKEDYGIDFKEATFRLEEKANLERRLETSNSDDEQNVSTELKDKTLELVAPVDALGVKRRKKEIDELRSKLQDLGSVNLEAIETLETLKTRYASLFNQYNDLTTARKSIQKIIERVNSDCKRLFEETFETVRGYFCNIFQKLFGGGRADLTLENPSDPLNSGVEIVARPPGKDLKSLTLMSGGEKSLTCVALLLAIFQYRVSPICILDEVDAALDEGNVGRFSSALLDFIPNTQFLLVTHSKKTMSSAKAIYGVTMEDSGVSKILSVHFDDVGEDGEILIRADSKRDGNSKIARNVAV